MTTLTGHQIEGARLLALRAMLKLEMKGIPRSRAPTAYSMLKKMGYKGTRAEVLAQLDVVRNEMLGESK
jgi:hypothetical protein